MRLIRAILGAVVVAALLVQPLAALAIDHSRRLVHYTHQRWIEGSEAPAPVLAMAQGRDGFLWLATGEGLFRFDGINFEAIRPEDRAAQDDQPSTVLVARNGDVWTSFEGTRRFAVYRQGKLNLIRAPAAPDRIMALAEGSEGSIWALTAEHAASVLQFYKGRWRRFGAAQGIPRDDALSMLVATDGALWISLSSSVIRLAPGAKRFELVRETPRANGTISLDPAGRIWLSEKHGSYPITGVGGIGSPPPLHFPYRTDASQIRGAPMFDRAGNLWIATRYGGVQRVALPDPSGPRSQTAAEARLEVFRARDGLSSDVTYQALEDREGNVWIGSENGLDKFRPATLQFEPALTAPAAFGDKLTEASDGSVYIGQSKTIYRVAPGGEPKPILQNVHEPQSICEAPDGAIWVGFATYMIVMKAGRIRKIGNRPASHSIIYDCAFDARGDFWFSAGGGGVHRYHDGLWEAMFVPVGANNIDLTTMVRDSRGRLVVQWDRSRLAWIDYPARSFIHLDFGAAKPEPITLYAAANGDVLAGGRFGLSRFRAGTVQTRWADPLSLNSRINGIVRTPGGDVWLAYPKALVRIRSRDVERFFSDRAFSPPVLSLGLSDGLTSRPHSHSQRAMVRGGDGRLWIATETDTLWMDPDHIVRNIRPPGLAIKSLVADTHFHRDPASLGLKAATANIEIDFAALSMADPKRVNVRYMLEGFDRSWLDPGVRRQAFYTNLPPGKYRFRVIAANDEGVWNRVGASVAFEIPPTFFQSRWFLVLCLMLTLALLWLAYRLRVAQLTQAMQARLEERLGERERIARELHDTLLQSVQGLILRFQSVANKMSAKEPTRMHLESALARADEIVAEGRDQVRDLRVAEPPDELLHLLKKRAAAADFDPSVPIRIVVEGKPRLVHPLISAEIGRIASEALFNVARHAKASAVEITLHFAARRLGLQIRDDGVGLPAEVLEKGHKPGHFGLVGMRERAERIGGTFSIDSPLGNGCTVTMTLPARLAFADRPSRRRRFGLFPRTKGVSHD